MARYDYRCTGCNTVFEIEHGMRERPQITCPSCGAPCTRVLNASGIVLKGSGFYNTDQRGKSGGTEATGAKKPMAEAKPAADKTSDTPAPAAIASSGDGGATGGTGSAPAAE